VADHQKDFSSVYKPFWFNFINSEGIAFPFFCIYLHTLYYKACKWLKYNWSLTYSFQSRVVPNFEAIRVQASYSVYGHSSLILLFHCMNGADRTGRENPWSGMRTSRTYVRCEMRTPKTQNWSEYRSCLHLAYVLSWRCACRSSPVLLFHCTNRSDRTGHVEWCTS
jgi:hypothetical protein